MRIAYQLYSSRNWGLAETLSMLSAAGFRFVEGYGGLFDDAPQLRAVLDDAGLSMTSAHLPLELLEADPAAALRLADLFGFEAVFVPFVAPDARPSDRAGWEAFATRVARTGAGLRDAGIAFGWHNHDFELSPLKGGATPLDILADAGLDLELDIGWLSRAGASPADVIDRYSGRIAAAHIKDIADPGAAASEDGWADVGHGLTDWPPVLGALRAAGVERLVLEHDNPSDHLRFATRSLAALRSFGDVE